MLAVQFNQKPTKREWEVKRIWIMKWNRKLK
jgi:hypothetical protein